MSPPNTTSEITELKEPNLVHRSKSPCMGTSKANKDAAIGKKLVHPVETDLIGLLEGRDPRNLSRIIVPHTKGVDLLQKSALKRPVKIGTSYASGIGISESVTLKQALRKLCISQASEMAAMKRLSKPIGVSVSSEAGTIKRLYSSIVVQVSESGNKEHEKLQEISFLPDKHPSKASQRKNEPSKMDGGGTSSKVSGSSSHKSIASSVKVVKPRIRDVLSTSEGGRKSPARVVPQKKEKTKYKSSMSLTKSSDSCKSDVSPRFVKPAVKSKNASGKKRNCETSSDSVSSSRNKPADKIITTPVRSKSGGKKEPVFLASRTMKLKSTSLEKNSCEAKPDSTPIFSGSGPNGMKSKELSRSKGEYSHSSKSSIGDYSSSASINGMKSKEFSRSKGECSYSSKSSIGDYSSSTSINGDSNQSGSSGTGIRPHMSNDVRWAAIRHVETSDRSIGLKNFKLLKRLGCGDIGTVYLAELTGMGCLFALKVMDIEFLISRKKMIRAQTEREILQMLDHPFLPTLYTHFTTDNLSCLVMEYCPGGDLHVLRQKQLGRSFSEPAARFYMAEVLLALEYLHMLGVVYRDLKPENILVREDGHIMLSDFDLSLHCTVNPTLPRLSSVGVVESTGRISGVCSESYCIDPLCLRPSWAQVSCFTPRLASSASAMTRKHKSDLATKVRPFPQLVVEPTEARSNSFVGTHEYLAPEIIKGECHGSSVDWWTLGIFLYELLFGRTPFKGANNEVTLANVVSQSLRFPENPVVSCHARDLIRGLLVKEPENRLGSVKGAAEIKSHPFFMGLNWALIRCATPPEVPQAYDCGIQQLDEPPKKKESKYMEFGGNEDGVEFELF